MRGFFFFQTVLLWYNLHATKFIHFKCAIQWFLLYSELYGPHHLILEHSHHLKKTLYVYKLSLAAMVWRLISSKFFVPILMWWYWGCLGHEGGVLSKEMNALIKETPQSSLPLAIMGGHSQEPADCNPEKGLRQTLNQLVSWSWTFQPPELWGEKSLLFKHCGPTPSLKYSVLAVTTPPRLRPWPHVMWDPGGNPGTEQRHWVKTEQSEQSVDFSSYERLTRYCDANVASYVR